MSITFKLFLSLARISSEKKTSTDIVITIRVHNYLATPAEINHYYPQLWRLIESGAFKIHIHKEYPFSHEGVAEAQMEQASGKTTGKLVIKVED